MSSNPRLRALNILQKILEQKKNLQECLTSQDEPFTYQLVYGTLRHYFSLSIMVDYAFKKPLAKSDHDIYLVLVLGVYQLEYLDIPEYAILKETVDMAARIKKIWAKKLVNAVLRRFLRERETFKQQCLLTEQSQYDHPVWFIEKIKKIYPTDWEAILQGNNQRAPLHLRVNTLHISREDYLQQLSQSSISAEELPHLPEGIILKKAMDVKSLPGFNEGYFSVQDAASQAVVDYLDLKPHLRVLDACAAPGGKTCHILEREPHLTELVALDNVQVRLNKITENLNRLKLKATVVCADATQPETWWNKQLFDRILLDAPCSATGVIRRHPDIKILRSPEEIQQAVLQQQKLLEALWPLLKADGLLVYTTCSVFPEENQEQVDAFVQRHSNAKLVFSKQVLPGNTENMDGFFYATISKI